MSTRTIVVTDGDERAALATVRSLGAAGYRCVVTSESGASLAGASTHADVDVVVPSALREPRAFADAIAAIVERESASVLIPVTEPAALAVLARRERFGPCAIPMPSLDLFRAACDKANVLELAASLGIAVPAQRSVAHRGAGVAGEIREFPVVLKPARSVGESGAVREKFGVTYAANAIELGERLRALSDGAFPVLVQQRVIGPGVGVFLLRWDGEIRAAFAHRRITEKPPTGGVSVYRESIPMDAELLARSRALLDRLDWRGVAMVEYKRDITTGRAYLMEVNGRFWGSLQLAIDAGVDFPRLLVSYALGERPAPVMTYTAGVRSRWWWGQIDHLVARRRRIEAGARDALMPGLATAVAQAVFGPLRTRDREEIFRWNDMRPFLRETARWFRGQ